MKKPLFYLLLTSLASSLLGGCYVNSQARGTLFIPAESQSHTTIIRRYPPPPHAPAHGYRYYSYDHELRYDASFGAYIVIGDPDLYFYDDHYIRYDHGHWQVRNRLQDIWQPARETDIPLKLKQRHGQRHAAKKHRKEHREEHHERRHQERYEKKHPARKHDHRHTNGPRHGQRHHHHGNELIYDADIGVYRLAKRPDIYFFNNRYFRQYRGKWQSAERVNGSWRRTQKRHIPETLRSMAHKQSHQHQERQYEDDQDSRGRPKLQDIWQPKQ